MTAGRWTRPGRLVVALVVSGLSVLGCAGSAAPAAAGATTSPLLATTSAPAASSASTSVGTPPPASAETGSPAAPALRRPPAPLLVTIRNFTFVPRQMVLAVNQRVVIVNRDTVAHTWSAAPHSGWSYDSGNLAPGGRATFAGFRRPGRYRVLCLYHAEMPSMTGVVTVR